MCACVCSFICLFMYIYIYIFTGLFLDTVELFCFLCQKSPVESKRSKKFETHVQSNH